MGAGEWACGGARGRRAPGQGEPPPDPDVVERLLLVIGRDHIAAVPVAALHDDLVAQLMLELIARRGRQAAELSGRPVAPDGIDADRLLGRIDGSKPLTIVLPRVICVGLPPPFL